MMKYLNVFTFGLRGRRHPALSNLITKQEVKQSCPHIKFLAGNYLTYKINQGGHLDAESANLAVTRRFVT